MVGCGERKINGGAWMFYPRAHQKVFSSKWRENCFFFSFSFLCFPGHVAPSFFLILFFFPFPRCCLLFFFSSFFWISWTVGVIVVLFCFVFKLDVIFFGTWFLFFNKFAWLYISKFVLIGHHFLTMVYK